MNSRLFCILATASVMAVPEVFASYLLINPTPNQKMNVLVRTHVIISGRGNDLGELPMEAALAKSLRIKTIFPNEQVVIYAVTTPDDKGPSINGNAVLEEFFGKNFSANIVEASSSVLSGTKILAELKTFSKLHLSIITVTQELWRAYSWTEWVNRIRPMP